MSARQPDAPTLSSDFDALEIGRLTWIGLIVAALGWVLLIGEGTLADIVPARSGRISPSLHADLFDIAKCIIASGFGLAIIGALQSGFGTLNRFFAAVLTRSSQRSPSASAPSAGRPPEPTHQRRPYRLLGDGSVEVETILGTRRFASMHEAREFI